MRNNKAILDEAARSVRRTFIGSVAGTTAMFAVVGAAGAYGMPENLTAHALSLAMAKFNMKLPAPAESAEVAFRTSAYSFKALAEALLPLMDGGGSLVGMDFDATKAWPIYDWMGVAKAALESVNRYLARDLGEQGVRVNLVSAGPVETPAAQGIPGFETLAGLWEKQAPLGWDTSDPGPVADAVLFLLSDMARGVTGEILHVDGGFHAMGAPIRD